MIQETGNWDPSGEYGIVQTRAVMKRCVAMGVAKIILGCDLNFQLGARMGETTGD